MTPPHRHQMGSPLGESNPRPTLREPLPALTLALTRHVGCAVGTYGRLRPPQMTPVRTTNGATPKSSRAPRSPPMLEGAEHSNLELAD